MNSIQKKIKKNFIDLIVQFVTNEKIINDLSEFEVMGIIKFAGYHSVEKIIYSSLKSLGIVVPEEFEKLNNVLFQKSIVQDCELESINNSFNEQKICHLPLKGSILKNYYPSIEYRSMADLDFFVKKNDLKKIKNILLDLGYKLQNEGGTHDVYIKPPFMNIEIHRNMLDVEFDNYNYYHDIWKKVIVKKEYTLGLSNEDFYIYNIIHAGKHFSFGGTGVKILIDIYYLIKQFPDLNFTYINNELGKINLQVFGNCLVNLSKKIFSKEELNDDEELLLDYILDSGTYGNLNNSSILGIIKNQDENEKRGKAKFILKRIFPSFKVLKQKYPTLEKYPFLVPYYWLKRLCAVIFNKKRREGYIKGISNSNQEKVEKIKRIKEITQIDD